MGTGGSQSVDLPCCTCAESSAPRGNTLGCSNVELTQSSVLVSVAAASRSNGRNGSNGAERVVAKLSRSDMLALAEKEKLVALVARSHDEWRRSPLAGTVDDFMRRSSAPKPESSYFAGDAAYYGGMETRTPGGRDVVFGSECQVLIGGSSSSGDDAVVAFPGDVVGVCVPWAWISKDKPLIPGGYSIGDMIFYCGPCMHLTSGDILSFGLEGVVMCRSDLGDGRDDHCLAAFFAGHRSIVNVFLSELARAPPTMPEGYKVGDSVVYSGEGITFGSSGELRPGAKGEVVGGSTVGDGMDHARVAVKFPGRKRSVNVCLAEVSRAPPGVHEGRPGS